MNVDIHFLIWLLLLCIATEATVEVSLKGKIFEGIRERVYSVIRQGSFLGELIRCPYCLSFWVAGLIVAAYSFSPKFAFWYCTWLTVCRASNILNDIRDKIFYGQYGNLKS